MKTPDRLRRRRDFRRALGGTRVYAGRTLVGLAVASAGPESRVGVTVSRRVGNAVRRNRARRRLREAARLRLLADDSPLRGRGMKYDVVLIGRPPAVDASFADILEDADVFLRRLAVALRS